MDRRGAPPVDSPTPMSGKGMDTIGVDTGGTFTDLVRAGEDGWHTEKLPSTPDDPSRAVLEGIGRLGGLERLQEVVHGTTVALNALLTGRFARAALVVNEGFLDLVEIGRQARPELYALHPVKEPPMIPRERRFELPQRSWPGPDGRLVHERQPTREELAALRRRIERSGAESVAVCLLHAYADPTIEERVARALRPLGLPITCSAAILREYREVERFSTASANAVLQPVLARYLESGYLLLGISNQSGVAAGTLTEEQAIACFDRTVELLGVPIDVRFCPHPSGAVTCWCRKPMPGMAVQLIEEYDLDPAQCVMVGDMETDRECAAAAGLRYEDAAGFFAPPAGSGIDH